MPGMPQGMELIILAVVALILFGGAKIAGFGKNAGKAIREFKEESRMIDDKKVSGATAAPAQTATTQTVTTQPVAPQHVADAELVEPAPLTEQKPYQA